ncbi:MAG: leucine-rich repeat protein [Lachnospiraceae bacterium]|nr:leucine-rich repeat protein [Lachnospiraceae bacterium]
MKKKLYRSIFLLVLAAMLLPAQIMTAAAAELRPGRAGTASDSKEELTITAIDVGKGDCILVETNDATVMIDTGYEKTSEDVLSYLSENGVEKLDVLIISHYDKDHVGGAADVIRSVPVGRVYLPDYTGTGKKYKKMIEALEEVKVPYRLISRESGFRLGGAYWKLYPSGVSFDGDNDNDCSLAASVRCGQSSALFAGDLEEDGIAYFVSKYKALRPFDILKMPHHGNNEDNTGELVALAYPKIALITDGHERRASGKTLELLAERKVEVYSSAEGGTITVRGKDNGEYVVETAITEQPGIPDQSGEWRYELSEDGKAAITAYEGSEDVLSIPAEIDGHPVTGIGPSAFYNCRDLKKVSIPEGVTDIGASAFSWCTDLEEADLPAGLSTIGEAAFSWCYSLESIVIPDSIRVIDDAVFTRSGLKEATIHAGVESLGDSSFSHCKKLGTIRFMGTEEQWNGIKKDKDWNKKSNTDMKIEYVIP